MFPAFVYCVRIKVCRYVGIKVLDKSQFSPDDKGEEDKNTSTTFNSPQKSYVEKEKS